MTIQEAIQNPWCITGIQILKGYPINPTVMLELQQGKETRRNAAEGENPLAAMAKAFGRIMDMDIGLHSVTVSGGEQVGKTHQARAAITINNGEAVYIGHGEHSDGDAAAAHAIMGAINQHLSLVLR